MTNHVRHPERVHLRRYSRAGYLVVSCNGQSVRDGTSVKFANRIEAATCPDCVRRAQREAGEAIRAAVSG